jgi:hypothetical protein
MIPNAFAVRLRPTVGKLGMPDAVRRAFPCVVLAFCGGYGYAQSMKVPTILRPPVSPTSSGPSSAPSAPPPADAVTLTGLEPTSAVDAKFKTPAGATGILTANGANFADGCTINWNGSPMKTDFVEPIPSSPAKPSIPAHLTASVTDAQINSIGPGNKAAVTVTCSGSTTAPVAFFVGATLTGLLPTSAPDGPVTLTANGTNFAATGCNINWNGTDLKPTNFVSEKQLTATVTADQFTKLQAGDNVPVKVKCGDTLGTTVALSFTVGSGLTAGAPTLTGISPPSAGFNDNHVVLTLTGTNFGDGCMVNWNGVAIPTYVNSATQLTVTITPGQIPAPGVRTGSDTQVKTAGGETVNVLADEAVVPVAKAGTIV